MPEINFFTPERMTEFWGYVKMLLSTVSPGVMLVAAIAAVGMIATIVIKAFKKSASDKDDENEDYEIKHY